MNERQAKAYVNRKERPPGLDMTDVCELCQHIQLTGNEATMKCNKYDYMVRRWQVCDMFERPVF